jgi:hypothetical protein
MGKLSALHRMMNQRVILSGLFQRTLHGILGPSKPFAEVLVCQLHSNQSRTSDSDNAVFCYEPSLQKMRATYREIGAGFTRLRLQTRRGLAG